MSHQRCRTFARRLSWRRLRSDPTKPRVYFEEVARIELAGGDRVAGVRALAECFSMYMATSFVDDANRVFDRWSALVQTDAERLKLHSQRAHQQTGFRYLTVALEHSQTAKAIIDAHRDTLDAADLADAFTDIAAAFVNSGHALEALALAQSIAPLLDLSNREVELDYRIGLAQALSALGRHAEAIESLRRAMQLHATGVDPLSEWDTRSKLAWYLGRCGRNDEAADRGAARDRGRPAPAAFSDRDKQRSLRAR